MRPKALFPSSLSLSGPAGGGTGGLSQTRRRRRRAWAGRCVIVPPFSELLEHSRFDTLSSLYVTEDSYVTRVR